MDCQRNQPRLISHCGVAVAPSKHLAVVTPKGIEGRLRSFHAFGNTYSGSVWSSSDLY